ncbi:MAG: catalase [Holdemanella sp.]|nr:catalase [Holdemanella sp.]
MNKVIGHLNTINQHKIKVTELCFRCHLYKQGVLHDLSKYSICELKTGFKYYQGYRSPIDAQKEDIGYSTSWLHHKGRNKHHWEYWLDFNKDGIYAVKMPTNYVIEMFCDRVAATMIYQKDKYTDRSALDYYLKGRNRILIHEDTDKLILHLLTYLSENGLDKTIDYIVKEIKE